MIDNEIKELVNAACKKAEEFLAGGRPQEAAFTAEQILKVDPDCYEAKLVVGMCIAYKGDTVESKKYLLKTIATDPKDFRGYNNLGLVAAITGDSDQAIYYFEEAAKRTTDPGPSINLALELSKSGRDTQAEDMLSQLASKSPVAEFNYAGFLHRQTRIEDAEKVYREILSKRQDKLTECNLAKICLLTGRMKEGYKLLESRWDAFPHLAAIKAQLKSPLWDGSPGKRIVLFCEQGLGDYIQFARYAKEVAKISKEVYLDVGKNLKEAFANVGVKLYQGEPVDACCSVISLPNLIGTDIVDPVTITATEINFNKFQEKFKIGLCWCGSPNHPDDLSRSIPLREFESMSYMEDSKWFSCGWSYGNQMRNGKVINWEDGAENVKIADTGAVQVDVSKTAGIISAMDLVITVDTATAHIAGSLGKETWLLLPYNAEWRWGRSEEVTPWYQSIKIFRQERIGDWYNVLSDVHFNLNCSFTEKKRTQLFNEH